MLKRLWPLATLIFLSGCAQMIPGMEKAIDDYVTDGVVTVTVDRAAMQNNADIDIAIKVTNKDDKPIPPVINVNNTK